MVSCERLIVLNFAPSSAPLSASDSGSEALHKCTLALLEGTLWAFLEKNNDFIAIMSQNSGLSRNISGQYSDKTAETQLAPVEK